MNEFTKLKENQHKLNTHRIKRRKVRIYKKKYNSLTAYNNRVAKILCILYVILYHWFSLID